MRLECTTKKRNSGIYGCIFDWWKIEIVLEYEKEKHSIKNYIILKDIVNKCVKNSTHVITESTDNGNGEMLPPGLGTNQGTIKYIETMKPHTIVKKLNWIHGKKENTLTALDDSTESKKRGATTWHWSESRNNTT